LEDFSKKTSRRRLRQFTGEDLTQRAQSRQGRKERKRGCFMQAVPDKITPRLLTKTPSLPLASFAPLRDK
jgi:hypothetical protein